METASEERGTHRHDGLRSVIGGVAFLGFLGSTMAFAAEKSDISANIAVFGMVGTAIGMAQAGLPVWRMLDPER